MTTVGNRRTPLVTRLLALLLVAPSMLACGEEDAEAPVSDNGVCEVAGDGIRASCYEDFTWECSGSSSRTFHAGTTCNALGYTIPCCSSSRSTTPTQFRPTGGACDATETVCGSGGGSNEDACSRCLDNCCNGCDCNCERVCL